MHCLNCIRCMQNSTFETGLKFKIYKIKKVKKRRLLRAVACAQYIQNIIPNLGLKAVLSVLFYVQVVDLLSEA